MRGLRGPDGGGQGRHGQRSGSPPRKPGARVLLALGLAAVVPAALLAGTTLADLAARLIGISSPRIVLALKVILVVAFLPAGFHIVERIFITRATRGKDGGGGGRERKESRGPGDPGRGPGASS